MSYPFVHAAADYGPRKGPTRGFVVHMAEGGGTVGFLSRENARGVSVHYVIEYTGRIVQMLREDHVSGSINPNDLRTTEGPDPYGASVGKAVLKAWWGNPNEAVITVEIEGFARDGPNVKQSASLVALVDDVRSRYPDIGLLGHRDFQDYKACPGAHIPWDALGGHGPATLEDDVTIAPYLQVGGPGRFTIKAGTTARGYSISPTGWVVTKTLTPTSDTGAHYSAVLATTADASPKSVLAVDTGSFAGLYIPTTDTADETPDPVPVPQPTPATVLVPGIYEVKA